jgi:hypothetical protein
MIDLAVARPGQTFVNANFKILVSADPKTGTVTIAEDGPDENAAQCYECPGQRKVRRV